MNTMFGAVFALPFLIVWLCFLGLSIYALVLFIKLATRGIKALDIYIEKNRGTIGSGFKEL